MKIFGISMKTNIFVKIVCLNYVVCVSLHRYNICDYRKKKQLKKSRYEKKEGYKPQVKKKTSIK